MQQGFRGTVHHGSTWKSDGDAHCQVARLGKEARAKAGEPPVSAPHGKKGAALIAKLDADGEHELIRHTVKQRATILLGIYEGIRSIDAHFRTCVQAVLAFPEFNQPRMSLIIKIDWLTVKYHVKAGGSFVI